VPLFVAVVPLPPEWHMWGYNPKNFLLASLAVIFVPLTVTTVAPPVRPVRAECGLNVVKAPRIHGQTAPITTSSGYRLKLG